MAQLAGYSNARSAQASFGPLKKRLLGGDTPKKEPKKDAKGSASTPRKRKKAIPSDDDEPDTPTKRPKTEPPKTEPAATPFEAAAAQVDTTHKTAAPSALPQDTCEDDADKSFREFVKAESEEEA